MAICETDILMWYGEQSLATPIKRRIQSPTGLQNPSAWARPNWARERSSECQPSINSTNVVWNTFVNEFSEGRQSGERINLGLSFASFGQAKEDESYMPICRRYGFIYDSPTSKYVAHELAHGAFALHHTFSRENKYVASQGATTNLMDYSCNATSTDLYKYQWDYVHNPEFVLFRGDDEEGEAWSEGTRYKCISTELATLIKSKYRYFYYPDGSIVDMKDHLPSGFYLSTDVDAVTSYGAVATIREGDRDLFYDFSRSNNNANVGYGYRLNGNAICKYKLPSISSEKASELNPVHVRLKENQVTIIDFMGHELESFVEEIINKCKKIE